MCIFSPCGVGRVISEGYRCIRVFSVMDSPVAKLVQEGTVLEFDATFQLDDRCISKIHTLRKCICYQTSSHLFWRLVVSPVHTHTHVSVY